MLRLLLGDFFQFQKNLAWSLLGFMLSKNGMPDEICCYGFNFIHNVTLEEQH